MSVPREKSTLVPMLISPGLGVRCALSKKVYHRMSFPGEVDMRDLELVGTSFDTFPSGHAHRALLGAQDSFDIFPHLSRSQGLNR